ncbi:hypothetical protein ACFPK9_08535 [Rubritalea spongiae]|uniref:Tetratricopeptide repeat protein n=1 Tax=Rubritalea spongiae TaxID=430797 RepID=A0ABW5E4P0_9BACT
MDHPYESTLMRTWKRKRKGLYLLGQIVLFPMLVLWKLDRLFSGFSFWIKVSAFCSAITAPFRAVIDFIKAWCGSRPWKRLLQASPVLIIAFVGFTAFFINANRNRGGVYAGYYQDALTAMNAGDAKQADFLFGKLIHHKNYRDNNQALFQAMMAANANDNATREQALRKKLVVERNYEPAKRWVVAQRLNQGRVSAEDTAGLVALSEEMVAEAPTEESELYWRKALARLYQGQGKYSEVVAMLEADENRDPEASLILAQNYLAQSKNEEALKEVDRMLSYISDEDPAKNIYLKEYVEGNAIKAHNTADLASGSVMLKNAIKVLEQKRAMAVNRALYDAWLGELYLRMFEMLLEFRDASMRLEAFEYFDKAIEAGQAPGRSGAVLNQIIDPASGYPLLSGQILEIVAKRGGVGAHLARAMDAWVEGNDRSAQLHFSIANELSPNAMKVVRYAAQYLAREGSSAITVFTGVNLSSYQRSFELLNVVDKIDEGLAIETMFDRCYIYSLRKSWKEVLRMVEPRLSELTGQDLVRAYDWLANAHANLDNAEKAEEYRRALQNEIIKLKEQQ